MKSYRVAAGTLLPCALLAIVGTAAFVMPQTARAQGAPAVDRQARVWASSCAACHGGAATSAGGIPSIAGRDADLLWRTLLEFKNNQRPTATVMHQHTKGYTDDELKRIAQSLAASPVQ